MTRSFVLTKFLGMVIVTSIASLYYRINKKIKRLAAARRGEARRKNYSLKIADSAIAATALFTGSILLTRNVKDFRRVPELKLQSA